MEVNQVQRFYSFDSGQSPKPQGAAGYQVVCRSASLCFPATWDTKDSIGQDVIRALKLVKAEGEMEENSIRVDHLPDRL